MLHTEAAQVLTQAFGKVAGRAPSASELGYCRAVAWLETFYGRGGQFAKLFGKGMVNWGALERTKNADGSCPTGTALGSDVGTVCFFVYPSDVDAATAFLSVLLTNSRTPGKPPQPAMLQAMTGAPGDVAQAMKDNGYFGAPVDQYAQAIQTSLAVTSGPGGITDQGLQFKTAAPPAGTPPQTAPGQPPLTGGAAATPWYRSTPVLAAAGVAIAGTIFFAARRG